MLSRGKLAPSTKTVTEMWAISMIRKLLLYIHFHQQYAPHMNGIQKAKVINTTIKSIAKFRTKKWMNKKKRSQINIYWRLSLSIHFIQLIAKEGGSILALLYFPSQFNAYNCDPTALTPLLLTQNQPELIIIQRVDSCIWHTPEFQLEKMFWFNEVSKNNYMNLKSRVRAIDQHEKKRSGKWQQQFRFPFFRLQFWYLDLNQTENLDIDMINLILWKQNGNDKRILHFWKLNHSNLS